MVNPLLIVLHSLIIVVHPLRRCVHSGFNILSLYGARVPYNICRNLEWQVCAAKGRIPGQNSKKIVFGKKPSELDPNPGGGKPLGTCGGWVPAWLNNHHWYAGEHGDAPSPHSGPPPPS